MTPVIANPGVKANVAVVAVLAAWVTIGGGGVGGTVPVVAGGTVMLVTIESN